MARERQKITLVRLSRAIPGLVGTTFQPSKDVDLDFGRGGIKILLKKKQEAIVVSYDKIDWYRVAWDPPMNAG